MLRTVWEALPIAFRMASSTLVWLLPTISLNRYTWSLTARLLTCPPPRWQRSSRSLARTARVRDPSRRQQGSGLDGDLDRQTLRDDVERLQGALERQPHRDEVLHRDLPAGDVLQRLLVVGRGGAVGPHDHQLAVMHQVRVALDVGMGLRQTPEDLDPPPPRGHPDRLLVGDVGLRR